jgi:hypothetical protein
MRPKSRIRRWDRPRIGPGIGPRIGPAIRRLARLMPAFLLASVACAAQYRVTHASALIDNVPKGGFYRVVLAPEFVAECRLDLSDIRIRDQFAQETPYVLKSDTHHDSLNAGMLAIPDPQISRKDSSNRHTYYRLRYDATYRIDRLSLVIREPALFKRQAAIFTGNDSSAQEVQTITIDPMDTAFNVPPVKAKYLLIDVANEDNAPLDISRVATAQSGIYLVTLLKPDHRYELICGDPEARAPNYDLHFFTDSMKEVPALVGLGPIQRLEKDYDRLSRNRSRGRSGVALLWSLVTVIGLLLLYVSVKLAKAVDKRDFGKKLSEKE